MCVCAQPQLFDYKQTLRTVTETLAIRCYYQQRFIIVPSTLRSLSCTYRSLCCHRFLLFTTSVLFRNSFCLTSQARVELMLIFVKIGQVDTVNERYQADIFLQARWREPLLDATWKSERQMKNWRAPSSVENPVLDLAPKRHFHTVRRCTGGEGELETVSQIHLLRTGTHMRACPHEHMHIPNSNSVPYLMNSDSLLKLQPQIIFLIHKP